VDDAALTKDRPITPGAGTIGATVVFVNDVVPTRQETDMPHQKNEGEGNRTAAREYNEATKRFTQSGRVEESGKKAKKAVEGREQAELERAEQVGKSKIREEDPAIERKPRH
jgi:hypothetical protein